MVKIINLNRKTVTKKDLLKEIDPIDIYTFYSREDVKVGGSMNSPLGKKDSKPSFGYFIGENGELCFNDYRLGGGDCIRFVELMYGLDHFMALSKIVIDFGLEDKFIVKDIKKEKSSPIILSDEEKKSIIEKAKNNFILKKKKRDWKLHDLNYWNEFGISLSTLKRYRVEPIEYYFINDRPIKADKYAYCFIEKKDDNITYKIYQPFSEHYKWINSHDGSTWQGWDQLPETGEELIITKSLKDVMSIQEMLGIPAISLQAESIHPKEHVIDELKKRFKSIYLLYDNDYDKETNWGQEFAKVLYEKYKFRNLIIPDKYKCTDFSELVKKFKNINPEYFPDGFVKQHLEEKIKTIWQCNIHMPF